MSIPASDLRRRRFLWDWNEAIIEDVRRGQPPPARWKSKPPAPRKLRKKKARR